MAKKKQTQLEKDIAIMKLRAAINQRRAKLGLQKTSPNLTNPGKLIKAGQWVKAKAIRIHNGKLEILK